MKKSHTLDPTVAQTRPKRILFFDTETERHEAENKTTIHKLKLGHAKYCELDQDGRLVVIDWLDFQTPGQFWSYVDGKTRSRHTLYLVAHNFIFDLAVVDGFIEPSLIDWKLNSFYSKGMISIFRWVKGDCRIIGLDNGNFFSGSLERWGVIFGMHKLEIDFDTATNEELQVYCERDVEIMLRCWQTWLQFLDDHDCGAFKPTLASTAFNTWRYRFMKGKVYIHDKEDILDLERESYKGGRTECFWIGHSENGPFYYLDVNSMYSYVMRSFRFPAAFLGASDGLTGHDLAYKLERYDVIARVSVQVDEPWFSMRNGPFTCYPLGEFDTVLTTPEIKLCIDRGWLQDVHQVAWYRTRRLFTDYADYFYHIRREYQRQGNIGYDKICKLLGNALYGKFGQRGFNQQVIGECDPYKFAREKVFELETGKVYDHVYIGGQIFKEWREGESYHSAPAIAAHVTAYARMYLYSLVRLVPPEHVYYVDTDSLVVDQVGFDSLKHLIVEGELGKLKIENKSPWLTVHAPKDYGLATRHRMKGFSLKAIEVEDNKYQQTHFPKLRGLIQNAIVRGYITQQVIKSPKREIHSGVVQPDGWIAPFVFQGEETPPLVHFPLFVDLQS